MTQALCRLAQNDDGSIACVDCKRPTPTRFGLSHKRFCDARCEESSPATREIKRNPALTPKETDLKRLASLLEPCNCPAGKAENRNAALRMIEQWPKPAVLDNGRWAVGVTTAPRNGGKLRPTLDALRNNGWRPYVFAEPGSDLANPGDCLVRVNPKRLGAWHNWKFAAETLLAETDAELILIVQDDTIVLPGVRQFVERSQWPVDAGFLSLYLSRRQSLPLGNKIGIVQVTKSRDTDDEDKPAGLYWGACAWAFKRERLKEILTSKLMSTWKGIKAEDNPDRKPEDVKHIDNGVSRAVKRMRLGWYAISPSASQHVAEHSSIWEKNGDGGDRGAISLVSDWAVLDGTRKASTGREDYDSAMAAWSRLVGRCDYPLSPVLWDYIKPLLSPEAKVLEFGSGLSTRLIRSTGASLTSIEQDATIAAASGATHCPLTRSGWYDWVPDGTRYDLILIDGPALKGREGILPFIPDLILPGGTIIVDDCQRRNERGLATMIAGLVGSNFSIGTDGGRRSWGVVRLP